MRAIAATKTRTPPIEATVAITTVRVWEELDDVVSAMALGVEDGVELAAGAVAEGVRDEVEFAVVVISCLHMPDQWERTPATALGKRTCTLWNPAE